MIEQLHKIYAKRCTKMLQVKHLKFKTRHVILL